MTMELDVIKCAPVYEMLDAVAHGMAWNDARYRYGMAEPRYPMPAIALLAVYATSWNWDGVEGWEALYLVDVHNNWLIHKSWVSD